MPFIRYIPCVVVALLAAIACIGVSAQESFRNYGIVDGLSSGFVMSATEDSRGFVWIATEEGLNRFDGYGFTNFTKENSGLSANELNAVLQDPSDPDKIWIATQRAGVCLYRHSTDAIEDVGMDWLSSPDVTDLCPASDGGIWAVHYHWGVQHYDSRTGRSRRYNPKTLAGFPSQCWTMAEGRDGKIYIGHVRAGFSEIDTVAHTFVNYRVENTGGMLPGNDVYAVQVDEVGNVWLGTDAGAALFIPRSREIIPFVHSASDSGSITPGRVRSIRQMADGEIWFGTAPGGVCILDARSYTYSDIRRARFRKLPVNASAAGPSSTFVRTIFQDSFGNIWLGNYRSGVDVSNHLSERFGRIEYMGQSRYGEFYKPAWSCVCSGEGVMWVGGENEIARIDNGAVTTIQLPGRSSRTMVRALAVDSSGRLWIGTTDIGAFIYRPEKKQFTSVEGMPEYVASFCEHDGAMWAATEKGLYVSDGTNARALDSINSQLGDLIVRALCFDRCGNIWVGTFGKGIFVFDSGGHLLASHQTASGFPSNAVNSLLCDSRGRIWCATRGGIVMFPDSAECSRYTLVGALQGLDRAHMKTVVEDHNGDIWVSSSRGVIRVDGNSLEAAVYGGDRTLPLNSFNENAGVAAADGHVYFASANGVFSLSPAALADDAVPGNVVLTALSLLGLKDTAVPVHGDKVTLASDCNDFTICFGIVDHAMVDRTDVAYRMKGLDDKWIDAEGNNKAVFHNLDPGKYEFEVRRRINGHPWQAGMTLLHIDIRPPLWLTWWMKLLYIIALLGIAAGLTMAYRKRMRARQELQAEKERDIGRQRLNEERLRFYTNITHELRTPLTLILGPIEDLADDPALPGRYAHKLQLIRESSQRLLNLINGILEFRKTETQHRRLSVRRGKLANLLREHALRYKELNRNPDVTFVIDIEPDAPDIFFDRDMLTTVFDNLLSNAVKYTPRGTITVSYHTVKDADGTRWAEMKVSDTGYGIARDFLPRLFDRYYQVNGNHQASGTGIGLSLVKSLLELHDGTVGVDSREGEGSVFTVRLKADATYPDALHGNETAKLPLADSPSGDDGEPSPPERLTLLVVEDNDDIREYIAQALEGEFRVVVARNGYEGLRAVEESAPDIIVSDIMMPEMDGISMCRTLKDDILTSHIPVILLTAKDSLGDREEGYESGADSYLTKPFSARLLLSRIHNILRQRRLIAAALMSKNISTAAGSHEAAAEDGAEAEKALNPLDRQFLDKLNGIIAESIADEELGVASVADRMCMSQSTLYRKTMAILGVGTLEYIRRMRLGKAVELLRTGTMSVTEIAFSTGFGSHSSFGKAFKKEFGVSPTEYIRSFKE